MATQRTTHTLDEGRITFGDLEQTTAQDPVCKMNVDPIGQGTKKIEFEGKIYFFCSEECRDNFALDPDKFTRS